MGFLAEHIPDIKVWNVYLDERGKRYRPPFEVIFHVPMPHDSLQFLEIFYTKTLNKSTLSRPRVNIKTFSVCKDTHYNDKPSKDRVIYMMAIPIPAFFIAKWFLSCIVSGCILFVSTYLELWYKGCIKTWLQFFVRILMMQWFIVLEP